LRKGTNFFYDNSSGICDIPAYSSNRLKITLTGRKEEEILVSRERVAGFKKWMDR
jgi:hypothetical protein